MEKSGRGEKAKRKVNMREEEKVRKGGSKSKGISREMERRDKGKGGRGRKGRGGRGIT